MCNMNVEITQRTLFNGYGRLRPFSNLYEANVEGRRFDNKSLAEIKRVIKSRFPGVKIDFTIIDQRASV